MNILAYFTVSSVAKKKDLRIRHQVVPPSFYSLPDNFAHQFLGFYSFHVARPVEAFEMRPQRGGRPVGCLQLEVADPANGDHSVPNFDKKLPNRTLS
jgi:hypothetical protein